VGEGGGRGVISVGEASPMLPHLDKSLLVSQQLVSLCLDGAFDFVAVDCRSLDDPEDGMVALGETTFMEEAVYSCDTGFELIGDSTRTCLASAMWSGFPPTCLGRFR
jgi:hypothetical protein